MNLQVIYSSKLYKSSKNKDRILAAIQNPVNVELIEQLREYVDEDSLPDKKHLTMKFYSKEDLDTSNDSSESFQVDNQVSSEPKGNDSSINESSPDNSSSKDSSVNPDMPRPESEKFEDFENEPPAQEEFLEERLGEDQMNETSSNPDESIVESVHLNNSSPISASELVVSDDSLSSKMHLITLSKDIVNEIKGTLNSRQETCGVDRIVSKGDELWIYYNDKTNLNNIMSSVIELLEAANYNYLNFNRLARSENAIVFEVTFFSSVPNLRSLNDMEVSNG